MSYAPGVVDRSGELLAQGISGAGQSLADTINTLGQRQRQAKAYRAMAVDGLGMDPDKVDKLSLEDLTGIMQGQALKSTIAQRQALQAETQAKTTMLKQSADEADAMGRIAPVAQAWTQANPGKTPAPTDILQWMGAAKLNPRTQASLMQKLIPALMNGEGGGTPQPSFITSPTGNHYALLKNSMMNDNARTPVDDTELPAGFTAIPDGKGGSKVVRTPGEKTIPPAAQQQLTTYLNDYTSANDVLKSSDDELKANPAGLPPAQLRAAAAARLKRTQTNAKNLLDLQKKLGALDDDTHQSFLQNFGLANPPAAAAAPAAGGAGGRIPVWDKTGKQFTVPAAQKDQAVAGGYSLTAPQ